MNIMGNVYESHKRVMRIPMNRESYNVYRGWDLPEDEDKDGADEGYIVESLDGSKPNDKRHEGYINWSPKKQFDDSYTLVKENTFQTRLEIEIAELTEKQDRLIIFLGSEDSGVVTPVGRILLNKQSDLMQEYLNILAIRLQLVTK